MLTPAERDRLRVVLVATRNPLNIGAAARAISNFGFRHLRLASPYAVAFREARSAVGAPEILAEAEQFETVAEATADCTLIFGTVSASPRREKLHPMDALAAGAPILRQALAGGPVALLFGSEKRGLSNQDLSHCHRLLYIPTQDRQPSMNLGQAVAVCLYELARDSRSAVTPCPPLAPAADQERLTVALLDVLRATRYLQPGAGAEAEERTRRFVRRLHLSAADAHICLGMLRRVVWSLSAAKREQRQSDPPRCAP